MTRFGSKYIFVIAAAGLWAGFASAEGVRSSEGRATSDLGVVSSLSGEAGGLYMEGGLQRGAIPANAVQGKNSLVEESRLGKAGFGKEGSRPAAPRRSMGNLEGDRYRPNMLDKFLNWVGPQGTPKYFLVGLGLAVVAALILSAAFPAGISGAAVLGIVGGVIAIKLISDYRRNELPWQNPR